jgi:hypothetical protein
MDLVGSAVGELIGITEAVVAVLRDKAGRIGDVAEALQNDASKNSALTA